jgi:hypothetical protein
MYASAGILTVVIKNAVITVNILALGNSTK